MRRLRFRKLQTLIIAIGLLVTNVLPIFSQTAFAVAGDIGPWQTANSLPVTEGGAVTGIANNYAYVIGGGNPDGDVLNTAYYAHINSDGSVGTWNTTTPLPDARVYASSVISNNYIYVIGGSGTTTTDFQSTVYYAHLNSDGTLGAWNTAVNSLPTALSAASSVLVNGNVYVMGGLDSSFSAQSTVYYAHLNSDGTLGAWNTAVNSLPTGVYTETSVTSNGYIYVFGGINLSNPSVANYEFYAPVNSDGSIGSWVTPTSLPDGRSLASSVVANGYVYILGGIGDVTNVPDSDHSNVIIAKLNIDGSLGAWVTSSNELPNKLYAEGTALANGHIYTLGGAALDNDGNFIMPSPTYYTSAASQPVSTPTGLTATTPTNQKPALMWNVVDGATSYNVYRNGTDVGTSSTPTFTDSALSADGSYNYTVTATGSNGIESTQSTAFTVVYDATKPTVSRPTMSGGVTLPLLGQVFLVISSSNISTNVADNLSGVNSAEYYFDSDPGLGHGTPMTIASGHATATVDLTLLSLGTHTLHVRSHDAAGNWSNVASHTFTKVLSL
jgi:N-acetylneuraminic acid mutarotase